VDFSEFFRRATTFPPYPYQARLAQSAELPALLIAPTGAGKTEAAVLSAWLWRRQYHASEKVRRSVPRRLVYCLPMRTLVEQTHQRVTAWLGRLGLSDTIPVAMLMGGEERCEWHLQPEVAQIVIGTQDMLISRALNRGYAASPFRWPWDFGLLNNDCLWIMDEVQLMGNGLPTSTQLQAFREQFGVAGGCHTLWMSATVSPEWLHTVDFAAPSENSIVRLDPEDMASPDLRQRQDAVKMLRRLDVDVKDGDTLRLAHLVRELHRKGSMTLVVVNTVARAQRLYDSLSGLSVEAELVLVHSRYRPAERRKINERVVAPVEQAGDGRVVVATQAIEAGLDISARTLVTELAPWSSLVQRFGRCNRRGEHELAEVYWLDLASREADPYDSEDLDCSRERLLSLEGQSVAPAVLPPFNDPLRHRVVLRRRDLLELFDTTADLSGSYVDVSRFVRGGRDADVSVFWRSWEGDVPPSDLRTPGSEELCTVPVAQMRLFLSGGKKVWRQVETEAENSDGATAEEGDGEREASARGGRRAAQRRQAWRWNHAFGQWERVRPDDIHAGMTVLLHVTAGGYLVDRGWDHNARDPVPPIEPVDEGTPMESMDDELSNAGLAVWVPLRSHSLVVRDEVVRLLQALDMSSLSEEMRAALTIAAHYHDLGKAHPVFQETMLSNLDPDDRQCRAAVPWAKQGLGSRNGAMHSRPHFRHEVAGAVAVLSLETGLRGRAVDLCAYLVAAHHGKVRLAMRSLPRSRDQAPDERYLLLGFPIGLEDRAGSSSELEDTLPAVDLGDGVITSEVRVNLGLARMGVSPDGEYSWLDRTLDLRDWLGPFRLAYLEALLRAADGRASRAEQQGGGLSHD